MNDEPDNVSSSAASITYEPVVACNNESHESDIDDKEKLVGELKARSEIRDFAFSDSECNGPNEPQLRKSSKKLVLPPINPAFKRLDESHLIEIRALSDRRVDIAASRKAEISRRVHELMQAVSYDTLFQIKRGI